MNSETFCDQGYVHADIATLCEAGIQLRLYCTKRWAKTRADKGYELINGNVDVKDYGSINGSVDSIKINHCIFAQLSNKDNCRDYQTISQSLL